MSDTQPCHQLEPHAPHFWRTYGASPVIVSCGGVDPEQGHTGDRDRPDSPEFDWTPETLHIGDMAAVIMKLHQGESSNASFAYRSAIVLWETLTGLPEAEALTFAYQIGSAHPPVTAVVPPF